MRGERSRMRNRRLHDALRAFALDSARALSSDIEAGAEVAFELDERSTGRSVLYRYRPLIAPFISERWPQLRTLESFATAAEDLGAGSAAYLRVQGLNSDSDADAEPALLAMLERIWEDATSFAFPEDRFERVYEEVERALYEGVLSWSATASSSATVWRWFGVTCRGRRRRRSGRPVRQRSTVRAFART